MGFHGDFMVISWLFHGISWWFHGDFMVISWWFHGDFMGFHGDFNRFHGDFNRFHGDLKNLGSLKSPRLDSRPYFEPTHPGSAATPAHPPTGWRPPDRPDRPRAAAAPRSPAGRGATPSRRDPRCAPGRDEISICRSRHILAGGWPTPLKNHGVRQLGWWHSQLNGKIKNVRNYQPFPTCQVRVVRFYVSCLLLVLLLLLLSSSSS